MSKTPSLKRYKEYCLYLVVKFLELLIITIPEKSIMSFGRFLGRLGFVLISDRRNAAMENLTIAFGNERPSTWIKSTARKSFEHIGMMIIEFFRLRNWDENQLSDKIKIKGTDNFNKIMNSGTTGVLLLKSHFGCFEVSAASVVLLGMKLNLIQTGMKNPFLNRYFASRGGKRGVGVTTFPHKGVVNTMIRLLKQGENVACLADQRGDAERGVFVNFFGKKAPANEVFAKIAIEGNARVLPFRTFRLNDGAYQTEFCEEVILKTTGNRKNDLISVSSQFHEIFEEWLREFPEQGFWVQRKWRRKPSRKRKKHTK